MKEIWSDIIDFPGYEVSDLANVRNKKSKKPLKRTITAAGYYVYFRDKRNKFTGRGVHRVVATAFVDNPNNYEFVGFNDKDQYNPVAKNLSFFKDRFSASKTRGVKKEQTKIHKVKAKDELFIAEMLIMEKKRNDYLNPFKTKNQCYTDI